MRELINFLIYFCFIIKFKWSSKYCLGISEGLSVEEILKEAECIVRASTPYFERKLNSCSSDPLPLVKNIKHLSSVKKIIQKNYLSKTNNKSKDKDVLEPECIAQEKPTELHDSMVNRAQNLEGNEFNLNKNNNTPKVDEVKASTKNEINDVNSGLNSSFNNIMEEEKQYEIVQNELTLSDLQTVPPNATYTVTKEGIKLCRSMTGMYVLISVIDIYRNACVEEDFSFYFSIVDCLIHFCLVNVFF